MTQSARVRRIKCLLVGGLLLGSAPSAVWADRGCREGQKLAVIGSVAVGTTAQTQTPEVVTNSAAEVRAIIATCGSTACLWGVYDAASVKGNMTTANAVIEPGAPANQVAMIPQYGFLDQPITFTRGISVFNSGGNGSAIAFYGCTDR